MAEWYGRLAEHPTIVTTTPSEFLTKETTLPEIQTIGTGSWIDGTLEPGLVKKRRASLGSDWSRPQALVEFEEGHPNDPAHAAGIVYIAEGSDWYWWYGLDQDSGYDENWDALFKVHLPTFIAHQPRPSALPAGFVDQSSRGRPCSHRHR